MSTDLWKKQNTIQKNIRLSKNSNIVGALKSASEIKGVAESAYIREALIEKLQRDGYLKAGDSE